MARSLEPARGWVAGLVKAVLGRKTPGFKDNLVPPPGYKEQAGLCLNRWVPGASHLAFQLQNEENELIDFKTSTIA